MVVPAARRALRASMPRVWERAPRDWRRFGVVWPFVAAAAREKPPLLAARMKEPPGMPEPGSWLLWPTKREVSSAVPLLPGRICAVMPGVFGR